MIAAVPAALGEFAAWLGVIAVTITVLIFIVKGIRGLGRFAFGVNQLVTTAQTALLHFQPDADGKTLPDQVNEIGTDVRRMADGMETVALISEDLSLRVGHLEVEVGTLKKAVNE